MYRRDCFEYYPFRINTWSIDSYLFGYISLGLIGSILLSYSIIFTFTCVNMFDNNIYKNQDRTWYDWYENTRSTISWGYNATRDYCYNQIENLRSWYDGNNSDHSFTIQSSCSCLGGFDLPMVDWNSNRKVSKDNRKVKVSKDTIPRINLNSNPKISKDTVPRAPSDGKIMQLYTVTFFETLENESDIKINLSIDYLECFRSVMRTYLDLCSKGKDLYPIPAIRSFEMRNLNVSRDINSNYFSLIDIDQFRIKLVHLYYDDEAPWSYYTHYDHLSWILEKFILKVNGISEENFKFISDIVNFKTSVTRVMSTTMMSKIEKKNIDYIENAKLIEYRKDFEEVSEDEKFLFFWKLQIEYLDKLRRDHEEAHPNGLHYQIQEISIQNARYWSDFYADDDEEISDQIIRPRSAIECSLDIPMETSQSRTLSGYLDVIEEGIEEDTMELD